MQSIVYGEYLPIVLGQENFQDVQLSSDGTEYNPSVDPSMSTEFATAAYRFGHSLVQGLIKMFRTDNSGLQSLYWLSDNFFNTARYYENNGLGMEQILMGLITQESQKMDRHVTGNLNFVTRSFKAI